MKYYNPRKTKIFPKEGSFQEGKVLGASFPGGGNVLSSRSRQRIQGIQQLNDCVYVP